MFSIDSRSRVPIYEQLIQNIIGLIARGALQPDDQLPSVRSLARDLGINPNTVQKAYQELEAKGMIYQAAGRGSSLSTSTANSSVSFEAVPLPMAMTSAPCFSISRRKIAFDCAIFSAECVG